MQIGTMKFLVPIGAIILLLSALVYVQHDSISTLRRERDDAKEELAVANKKLKQIQVNSSKVQANAQSNRVKTKEVLDASPEFRDTVTPKPIVDSLCKVIRCS